MTHEGWQIAMRSDLHELYGKYKDYKKMASHIYEISEDHVTSQQRADVKEACFAYAYGIQSTPDNMIKFNKGTKP